MSVVESSVEAVLGAGRRAVYELWTGPFEGAALTVVSFEGKEAISRPYRFDVRVVAPLEGGALDAALVGAPATLSLQLTDGPARVVSGIVASVRSDGLSPVKDRSAARVRLVPRLWLLKRRATSRVFQGLTVPEIAKTVLDAADVPSAWRLAATYAKRDYCVQYQETDYAFVTRILAEEGIFFRFEQPELGDLAALLAGGLSETVVFQDQAADYADADDLHLELRDRGHAGLVDSKELRSFARRQALRSDAALVRDYDFERPLFNMRAEAALAGVEDGDPASAGPRLDAGFGAKNPRGVYDHRREHPLTALDPARAALRLEQLRVRGDVGIGAGRSAELAPGRRFFVDGGTASHLSAEYAVVAIAHEGHAPELHSGSATAQAPETYTNRFECVPATVAARPRRPKRRARAVMETAVVVGPEGEEIYADEYGRIKIQFHWDIEGAADETSSCWVRAVETWSGSSWGTQFIPRVGMEVLVSFLGGDPDRPVVTGCAYNATHPTPFNLPLQKTRSGIRTQSTPGGNGSNELSFDDALGAEQVFLHAQRDLDEVVDRNHTMKVLGDEVVAVTGDRGSTVEGDANEIVLGKATRRVESDETIRVEGNRLDVVENNAEVTVGGALTSHLGLERREIAGKVDHVIGDDYTVRTKGCFTTIVGRNEAKRSYVLRVEGTTQLSSSGAMVLDTEKGLTLRCGKSFLKISEDAIEIWSPSVTVRGEGGGIVADDKLSLRAKEEILVVSEQRVLLKTPDTSLGMKTEVQIDGKQILLNSPDKASDPVKDTSPPPTKIALKDQHGKPLAHQRFVITLADGSEFSGILDADGKTEMPIEGSGNITFPDLGGST